MLKIGEKRNFTFDKKESYQIIDIIKEPNFQYDWKKRSINCPHCNKIIEETISYSFNYIEILVPLSKLELNKNDILNHVLFLGISKDNKYVLIPKGYNNSLVKKSEFFNELFKNVNMQ